MLAALGVGLAAPVIPAPGGEKPDTERCGGGYGSWPKDFWNAARSKEFEDHYWKRIETKITEREKIDRAIRDQKATLARDPNFTLASLKEREKLDLEISVLRNSVTMDKCSFALALRYCASEVTPTPKP
ncbi:MAG: hypothetical protein LC796_10230 [Acidobacteria bacterium]|nr:hypothetical protein [Acidobacteriota bacterium]